MVNACERADTGEVIFDAADLASDLRVEGLDRERDAVVDISEGRIVGWGLVIHARKRWADVHPDARGQGIGTWLVHWSEYRARSTKAGRIGQTISDRRPDVARWFESLGYSPRYTSWVLRLDHPLEPGGVGTRVALPDEVDTALRLLEDAFSEHADRQPLGIASWRALTVQRPGSEAADLVVAVRGEEVVGAAFLIDSGEVWVDKFATRADVRGSGVGRALLAAVYERSVARGLDGVRLSTDSNSSALSFYTHLGMVVEESYTHYAIDLD